MSFNDAEKVQIRRWLGADFFYVYAQQRLEGAISTVEALPDGGETENYIKNTLLTRLEATFQELVKLENKLMALDADEVKVDPVRAVAAIKGIGRVYSQQLAHAFGLHAVFRDPWSAAPPDAGQQLGVLSIQP